MRFSSPLVLRSAFLAGTTALLAACVGHSGGTIPAMSNGASPMSAGAMSGSASSLLASPTPAPAPVINEYATTTAGAGPVDITSGPDGALWFTEQNANQIGRITTAGVVTNEFPITGATGPAPNGITLGPDNNLWFTEYSTNQIAKISTAGTVTQVATLAGQNPAFIVKGANNALWFTEYSGGGPGKVGQVTTAGVVHEYADGNGPWGITSGPDGALWFAEANSGTIGRMATTGTLIAQYPTAQPNPYNIAVGPDGAIWFSECGTFGDPSSTHVDSIGRVTLAGTVTNYPVKTQGSCPNGITAGPDGNMWFVENGYIVGPPGASAIGKITMAGIVTEYPLANATAGPQMIIKGPDGNIWFTENAASKIGEVVLAGTSSSGCGKNTDGDSGDKNGNGDKNGKGDKTDKGDKPTSDKDAKHGDNNRDGKKTQQCDNR